VRSCGRLTRWVQRRVRYIKRLQHFTVCWRPVYKHDQVAIWRTPVSHGKDFGMDGSNPVRPKGRTGFEIFIQLRRCPFDSGLTEPFGFGEPESRGLRLGLNEKPIHRPQSVENRHSIPPGEAIHHVPDYTKRDFTALATAISPAGDHKHGII
jgi:hypothetical protein